MDVHGKKLLVLGGTALSCEIIKQAQNRVSMCWSLIIWKTLPVRRSRIRVLWSAQPTLMRWSNLVREEKIDGVLTGFIEMMMPYYQAICEKTGLPCYATRAQFDIVEE